MYVASPQPAVFPGHQPLQFSLARAALHEFYAAAEADAPTMTGMALACAVLAAGTRPVLWVRHELLDLEAGAPYPPGLAEFGIDPTRLTLVRARDAPAALQAGLDGARCAALGAAVIEIRGEAKALDLTASRRLALAARASGACVLLARSGAQPQPSAAETRWHVRSAPSRALAANAPGNPAFSLSLLRHRGGLAPGQWHLEWNRDRACFEETAASGAIATGSGAPLSLGVVAVSFDRPDRAGDLAARFGETAPFRKTG